MKALRFLACPPPRDHVLGKPATAGVGRRSEGPLPRAPRGRESEESGEKKGEGGGAVLLKRAVGDLGSVRGKQGTRGREAGGEEGEGGREQEGVGGWEGWGGEVD